MIPWILRWTFFTCSREARAFGASSKTIDHIAPIVLYRRPRGSALKWLCFATPAATFGWANCMSSARPPARSKTISRSTCQIMASREKNRSSLTVNILFGIIYAELQIYSAIEAYRIIAAQQVARIASDESDLVNYSTTSVHLAVDLNLLFDRPSRMRVSSASRLR